MIAGFVIWSAISVLFAGIGIFTWKSKKTAGFYSGVRPPEVSDIRGYNRAVGILWLGYAFLFELLGLPFLFLKQNSAGFLWSILGTVLISIALAVVYNRILERYRKRNESRKETEDGNLGSV